MHYTFTLLSSAKPSVVSKVFSLDEQANLKKSTSANIVQAKCELRSVENLTQFGDLLDSLLHNQCLVYGTAPQKVTEIVTTKAWEEGGRPAHQSPRAKELFGWPDGGGILMLDYDAPKNGARAHSASEIIAQLIGAVPELADVQILMIPSTSSCLYHKDQELVGVKGIRFYILVDDAQDIERVGEIINARLWLSGVGRYEVSESGSLLERPLFDQSVWQTNRIDFCAGAKCQDGIEQRRGTPKIISGHKHSLDSSSLKDLSAALMSQLQINKSRARNAVLDFADSKKSAWVSKRLHDYRTNNPQFGDAQIHNMVYRAIDQKELQGDWRVVVKTKSGEQELTVAQLLESPEDFNGCVTLDPLEPNYDGRRFVGKLFLGSAFPNLHSFAHGGVNFRLFSRPVRIEILDGKEAEVIDSTLEVMRKAPNLFDFGDVLVEVTDDMKIKSIKEANLRYILGKLIQFEHDHKLKNPPPTLCKSIVEIGRHLKALKAVVSAPTLRPDGTVLATKGYDERTGLLLSTQDALVPVPECPTEMQAIKALNLLMEPFNQFPFVDELARSVHLAALLTVVVRPCLPTSPGFAYDAPVQGSGKSLLAGCVEVLGSGREPTIWPDVDVRNVDEVRKRGFTAIRSGDRTVIWDNVVGEFDSAALAGMMTSQMIKERLFNTQTVLEVPNKTLMIFTGNNFSPVNDMSRRVLICRIDPQTERPQARSFDLNPKDVCIFDRQRMVSAALTLIRFYLSSGAKKVGDTGSFSEWDTFVRQTVMHIGKTIAPNQYVDIAKSIELNQAEDPEMEMLLQLYQEWVKAFGSDWVTAKQVVAKVTNDWSDSEAKDLREALQQLVGPNWSSPKSLGKALKKRNGRLVAAMKLECHGSNGDNAKSWRITKKEIV